MFGFSLIELASHDHDDNIEAVNSRGDYKCHTCKDTFNKKVEFIVSIPHSAFRIRCCGNFHRNHYTLKTLIMLCVCFFLSFLTETYSFTQARVKHKT